MAWRTFRTIHIILAMSCLPIVLVADRQTGWSSSKNVSTLRHGLTDVDVQAKDGKTPLFIAAGNGSYSVAELLLQRGADINAEHKSGLRMDLETVDGGVSAACDGPSNPVKFVSVNTRGAPSLGNFPGEVINAGDHKEWAGFISKIDYFRQWLQNAALCDDDLVAFLDGDDVLWGGCSEEEFLSRYQSLSDQGSKIVFSAEMTCWTQDCRAAPRVPDSFSKDWSQFNTCGERWDEECAEKRKGCAGCDTSDPKPRFLNSGFFMGKVKSLREMTAWAMENYDKYSTRGDQSVYAVYWLNNTARVTLDYSTGLAFSLSDISRSALTVQRSEPGSTTIIRNNVFQLPTCFIHGNGRGRGLEKSMAQALTDASLSSLFTVFPHLSM